MGGIFDRARDHTSNCTKWLPGGNVGWVVRERDFVTPVKLTHLRSGCMRFRGWQVSSLGAAPTRVYSRELCYFSMSHVLPEATF